MSESPEALGDREAPAQGGLLSTASRRRMRIFFRHRGAMFGLGIILLMSLAALFPRLLSSHAPEQTIVFDGSQTGASAAEGPSASHFMGTDTLGRDVYSNIIHGARVSLRIGFISVAISAFFGLILGGLAGMSGAWIDWAVMRLVDVMLSFPSILLALLIVTMLGRGVEQVMIAVGVAGVPRFARQVRAEVLALRDRDYVLACRALGFGPIRTFFGHILPNALGPLTVLASLGIASAVLEAAGLGFLGLGASPQTPEWGTMLAENRDYLSRYWWLTFFPGLAIAMTVLGFNLIGDGIRDAYDPASLRRQG